MLRKWNLNVARRITNINPNNNKKNEDTWRKIQNVFSKLT